MKVTKEVLELYKKETVNMLRDLIDLLDEYFSCKVFDINFSDFVVKYDYLYYEENPEFLFEFIRDANCFQHATCDTAFADCVRLYALADDNSFLEYLAMMKRETFPDAFMFIKNIEDLVTTEFNILADVVK